MVASIRSARQRLARLVGWLTAPPAVAHTPEEQYRARALAALALFTLLMQSLMAIVELLVPNLHAGLHSALAGMVYAGFVYLLSRGRHYRLGILLSTVANFVWIFVLMLISPQPDLMATAMSLPLLVSTLFWPPRTVIAMGIISLGGVITWLWLVQDQVISSWFTITALAAATGLVGLIAYLRQRAGLRLAEQTTILLNERNLLRTLIDNVPDAIYVKDLDSHLVLLNPESLRRLGVTGPDQALGRTDADFFPAEAAQTWRSQEQEILRTGQMLIEPEVRIQHPNGENGWISSTKLPLRDGQGKITGLLGISHDITSHKNLIQALRESEERFRQLIENIQVGYWIFDLHSKQLLYVSPAYQALAGCSSEELRADPYAWLKTIHPEDRAQVLAAINQEEGGQNVDVEMRVVLPGREPRWARSRAFPILDENGQPYRIVGVVEDIHDRRQAEAQRMELNIERERVTMLQRFIGDASHDLMTPLTVLRSGLYLLEKTNTPEKQRERIGRIQGQIDRLEKLIRDMLTLSRLDSPVEGEFRFLHTNVNQFTAELVDEYQPHAQSSGLTLSFTPSPDLPSVLVDATKLDRALSNLLDNAIKHTPAGGRVSVSTRSDSPNVLIELSDTGIGISPDDLPHIFERFYRGQTHRPSDGSAGLGLAIALKIVEAHGGVMDVESTPGQGTIFRIALPAILKREPVAESVP